MMNLTFFKNFRLPPIKTIPRGRKGKKSARVFAHFADEQKKVAHEKKILPTSQLFFLYLHFVNVQQ